MSQTLLQTTITQLENTIKFTKCHKCGCQQGSIRAIVNNLPNFSDSDQAILMPLIDRAKATFLPIEYDCLGCKTCFPAIATNEIMTVYPLVQLEDDGCASEDINAQEREGWPPLPGNYKVMHHQAPVAVCTLNSKVLFQTIASTNHSDISVVGSLNTENLGIERMIKNITSNPHIRFLLLCGDDSEQRIGHLPGQSFVSLFENGIDRNGRILGAQGKRPILKNIAPALVEQFRNQVELVNMIGCVVPTEVIKIVEFWAKKTPGVFKGGNLMQLGVAKIQAKASSPLLLDPKGYFVVFPDGKTNTITVEHYQNNGILNLMIEGKDLGSLYMTIIDMGLISKLDHACYLGKELARAEESIRMGTAYLQDKAQEPHGVDSEETQSGNSNCKSTGCC